MIQFVDWECESLCACVSDSGVQKFPRDVQVVRALHVNRRVTTDELRKAKRVLVGEVLLELY